MLVIFIKSSWLQAFLLRILENSLHLMCNLSTPFISAHCRPQWLDIRLVSRLGSCPLSNATHVSLQPHTAIMTLSGEGDAQLSLYMGSLSWHRHRFALYCLASSAAKSKCGCCCPLLFISKLRATGKMSWVIPSIFDNKEIMLRTGTFHRVLTSGFQYCS